MTLHDLLFIVGPGYHAPQAARPIDAAPPLPDESDEERRSRSARAGATSSADEQIDRVLVAIANDLKGARDG